MALRKRGRRAHDRVLHRQRGFVVGQRQNAADVFFAYVWRNGVATDLPSLGGRYSGASDTNGAGQIGGQSGTATDGPFATLWIPR